MTPADQLQTAGSRLLSPQGQRIARCPVGLKSCVILSIVFRTGSRDDPT